MASNPMQRKSRNSFLLGVIVTLLIAGAIIALLFLQLKQKNDQLKGLESSKVNVYTLNQDVKAAQILTQDMFELKTVYRDTIPSNATSVSGVIDTWFLQTKEGETICSDKYGLYLDRSGEGQVADTIIEVMTNNGETIEDSKGNKIANGEHYVDVNGIIEKVKSLDNITQDEKGMFFVNTQGSDKITRVYQEELTDEFYIYKVDNTTMSTGNSRIRVKEYIEIKNVPVLAKVKMNKNTVITPELVVQSSETVTDDTRQQEYNVVIMPIDLMSNDYVDIRLMTPQGQDFIVISKVQVDIPMNADGTYIADTMRANLREDEILAMSSAIVEAAGVKGSKLYATKYVEPAMQMASTPTYTPNAAVTAQLGIRDGSLNSVDDLENPNIVQQAIQELRTRYSAAAVAARNNYLNQTINNADGYLENIQSEIEQDMGSALTTRQQYLESLNLLDE